MQQIELPEEHMLELSIDGLRRITLICTNQDLRELLLGFLRNEGIIKSLEEVESLQIDPSGCSALAALTQSALDRYRSGANLSASCRPSGLGGEQLTSHASIPDAPSDAKFDVADLDPFISAMDERAVLHRQTGGVHCSALFCEGRLVSCFEDVGRHNTLDKIAGDLLLRGLDPAGCLLLTTGRISSDMARKAAALGACAIASYSIATQRAFDLAKPAGIALVAYVNKGGRRILCNDWRFGACAE